jgi:hypothetical protein
MNINPSEVATIAGDAQVDHAIATLVLAFATDRVARWMYDDPHQYLLHIPRLFRALGTSSFAAGAAQRTRDGLGVALWLPPGVHGEDGPLEAVITESIVGEKQTEVAAIFERDGTLSANRAPLVLIAHRGRSITSEQRVRCGTTAAPASSMRPGAPPSVSLVIKLAKYHPLREARLSGHRGDRSGFVAFHLSYAAQCALKSRHTERGGRESSARSQ